MQGKRAPELLYNWINTVMADKVIFTAVIDRQFAKNIGLAENTIENITRIIRKASKEICGKELSSGVISDILIENKNGLWKIVVFKKSFN
jgi:hypothetical protein